MSAKQVPMDFSKYPHKPGWKRTGTSLEAARKISKSAETRTKIIELLLEQPRTADEIATALGLSVLYVRPRFSELVALGLICETGERRKNDSTMSASVWMVQP